MQYTSQGRDTTDDFDFSWILSRRASRMPACEAGQTRPARRPPSSRTSRARCVRSDHKGIRVGQSEVGRQHRESCRAPGCAPVAVVGAAGSALTRSPPLPAPPYGAAASSSDAVSSLDMEGMTAPVHDRSELEPVIAQVARTPDSGLIVIPDGFLNVHRAEIIALVERYRLPTIYPWRFFPQSGGLLSYGSDQRDQFRLAATYVDRILKGEKPSQLPVQAPVKFELVGPPKRWASKCRCIFSSAPTR